MNYVVSPRRSWWHRKVIGMYVINLDEVKSINYRANSRGELSNASVTIHFGYGFGRDTMFLHSEEATDFWDEFVKVTKIKPEFATLTQGAFEPAT